MDFGRLDDLKGMRFTLAKDEPRSIEVLSRGGGGLRAYVGLPTWKNKSWIGSLYPPKSRQKDMLLHYGEQLGSIELNSSFYAIPRHSTVTSWAEQTPQAFRFCPKVPRKIARDYRFEGPGAATVVERFCECFRLMGDRLGMAFVQLPSAFGPNHMHKLEGFLRGWPADVPLAVEFRKAGWFDNRRLIEPAFELLGELSMATVITDVAGRRDVCHASLPSPRLLIRFVADNLPSDKRRITAWAKRIAQWADQGLQELYFFIHQTDEGSAPPLAAAAVDQLNKTAALNLTPVNMHNRTLFG